MFLVTGHLLGGEPVLREDQTLQLSHGLYLLLRQEGRWDTETCPGLSQAKRLHRQEQVPSAAHPGTGRQAALTSSIDASQRESNPRVE